MSENEAIKELKEDYNELGKAIPCDTGWGVAINEAYSIAIKALEEIQQYRAIGTVRQVQDFITDWRQFRELGNLEEFKALKEKSVEKKPRFYAHNYYCTECGNLVGNNEFEWQRFLYCDKCGQKLDWE